MIKPGIMSSAGNLQLCAGKAGGCDAVAHAMSDNFDKWATDVLFLVDANNAFKSLSRRVLFHNLS